MAQSFSVAVPSSEIVLDRRRGEVVFTVANLLPTAVRGRFRLIPLGDSRESWLALVGEVITATLVASQTATAGYGLKILDAAPTSTGAAFTELDTEFGVIENTIESTTACVVTLLGREVLGTT